MEPVGVATITPSAENVVTYAPSTHTASRTRRCRARFSTMISFSAHCGSNAAPPSDSAVTARRSSIRAVPARTARISGAASSGATSVRNPIRPTLTTEDGRAEHRGDVRGAQERAVAADGDHEVGVLRPGSRRRPRTPPTSTPGGGEDRRDVGGGGHRRIAGRRARRGPTRFMPALLATAPAASTPAGAAPRRACSEELDVAGRARGSARA